MREKYKCQINFIPIFPFQPILHQCSSILMHLIYMALFVHSFSTINIYKILPSLIQIYQKSQNFMDLLMILSIYFVIFLINFDQ